MYFNRVILTYYAFLPSIDPTKFSLQKFSVEFNLRFHSRYFGWNSARD